MMINSVQVFSAVSLHLPILAKEKFVLLTLELLFLPPHKRVLIENSGGCL